MQIYTSEKMIAKVKHGAILITLFSNKNYVSRG